MGLRPMKTTEDNEFLASDRWKCAKSPSGAHFWIIQKYDMTCKYCQSYKPVNTNPPGWTKPESK